jgi:hypothetical protein
LFAVLLLTAIGGALILTSTSETMLAAHFRDNLAARYAAGAIVDREMDDLAGAADWTLVAGGVLPSAWVDGAPSGVRVLRDGTAVDLAQVVNLANCQKLTTCSTADLDAVTADRPWGVNNPRWTAYAYGYASGLLAGTANASPHYVVLLASATVGSPGWDVLALRAEAFGPRGAHAIVEATAGRPAATAGSVRLLSWREVR